MLRKVALLAFAVSLLAACATHTRIADIKFNPGRFQNHSVTVNGVVTNSWSIPLVPVQLYRVDDGSGDVTVVSRSGRAPTKGARVSVRGRVNQIGTFGGQSLGLHLEEENVHFRN